MCRIFPELQKMLLSDICGSMLEASVLSAVVVRFTTSEGEELKSIAWKVYTQRVKDQQGERAANSLVERFAERFPAADRPKLKDVFAGSTVDEKRKIISSLQLTVKEFRMLNLSCRMHEPAAVQGLEASLLQLAQDFHESQSKVFESSAAIAFKASVEGQAAEEYLDACETHLTELDETNLCTRDEVMEAGPAIRAHQKATLTAMRQAILAVQRHGGWESPTGDIPIHTDNTDLEKYWSWSNEWGQPAKNDTPNPLVEAFSPEFVAIIGDMRNRFAKQIERSAVTFVAAALSADPVGAAAARFLTAVNRSNTSKSASKRDLWLHMTTPKVSKYLESEDALATLRDLVSRLLDSKCISKTTGLTRDVAKRQPPFRTCREPNLHFRNIVGVVVCV